MARLCALAWHRQRCPQRSAVPSVQQGAAVCTITQAGKRKKLEGVVQERRTPCRHSVQPQRNLQARGLARHGVLAGHWHSCYIITEITAARTGMGMCMIPQAGRPENVEICGSSAACATTRQHSFHPTPNLHARRVAGVRALAGCCTLRLTGIEHCWRPRRHPASPACCVAVNQQSHGVMFTPAHLCDLHLAVLFRGLPARMRALRPTRKSTGEGAGTAPNICAKRLVASWE